MSAKIKEYIRITDIYLAYRKAKAEAFYESSYVDAIAFSKYEEDLTNNLQRLHKKLIHKDGLWRQDLEIVGGHTYIPKSLDSSMWGSKEDIFYKAADPIEDWKKQHKKARRKAHASFRLISTPSVDFQIISALWILKVGHLFDACIDSNVSFANRLRRIYSNFSFGEEEGTLNRDSSGLFKPYFSGYREWRDRGLSAMKESLENDQDILAVTMDIRRFYHYVSPEFLLRNNFLKKIGLSLNLQQSHFTRQFIDAINCWYRSTPDYLDRPDGALPVGLSASRIISNVLLCEFDRSVHEKTKPIYYGRYVDDVFLVINKTDEVDSGHNLLKWFARTLGNNIRYVENETEGSYLTATYPYSKDSVLLFASDKQKIFDLSSPHGLDLIEHISNQIKLQSSEYRLLSELPESNVEMASKALLASPDASLSADALRKADVISVKRLGFSLLLRDVENYEKNLLARDWSEVRNEFYALVDRYLLTPNGLFEYTKYLHRVFSLSIACGDFNVAKQFIDKLLCLFNLLEETTTVRSKGKIKYDMCKKFILNSYLQAAIQASTVREFDYPRTYTIIIKKLIELGADKLVIPTKKSLQTVSEKVLLADFGRRPYKDYWYYDQVINYLNVPVPRQRSIRKLLRISSIRNFRVMADLKVRIGRPLHFLQDH